jgi:hypothetical protein
MSKNGKKGKEAANRFRVGRHGGCEALLYEFRDPLANQSKDEESVTRPLGSDAIHIAAATFEEAFAHLRRERPGYWVDSVACLGLIEMASGTPLD